MVIRIIKKGNTLIKEPVIVKVKKPLSLRDEKVVALVASGSKKAPAMIKVGYSPKTARAPGKVFNKPEVKEAMNNIVEKIAQNRDKIIKALAEKDFTKDSAFNLSMMMNMHNKDVQLLSGLPTSREEYVLPEDEQKKLDELLELNKQK